MNMSVQKKPFLVNFGEFRKDSKNTVITVFCVPRFYHKFNENGNEA